MVHTHIVVHYIAEEMQPFNTAEKPAMLQTFDRPRIDWEKVYVINNSGTV